MAKTPEDKGITKKEAVRRTLVQLGRNAKAPEVLQSVRKNFGLEISPPHYFNIKSMLKHDGRKKRGRPPMPPHTRPNGKSNGKSNGSNGKTQPGLSLQEIQTVKELTRRHGPASLHELIDLVSR